MKGWLTKQLGEVYDVRDGTHDSPTYQSEGYALVTSKNLKNNGLSFDNIKYISEADYRKINERSAVHKGDILLAMIGTIGNPIVVEIEPEFAIKNVALLKVPNNQNSYFLKYYLETEYVRSKMESEAKGTTQKFVGLGYLRSFPIMLPSLQEQNRIVAIVDEAFEAINIAIENTKKNLTNSRELFESYLNTIFIQKGNGWIEKRLGEIAGKVSTGPFGSILHKSDYITDGIPIVNPANIEDDKIIPNFNKTIDQNMVKKLQSYILSENDVVVGRRGEIGRCAVVTSEQSGWLCGSGSFFIQPFINVDSVFLAHLIRSAKYKNKLEALSTGATMLNLSNQSLSELVIAMPSLDEQNQITDKLDDLKIETQRLEAIYQEKLVALTELKQSILQKAFTGELTADSANQTTKKAKEVIAA
jgi:type I restriction enzyme, S subunit